MNGDIPKNGRNLLMLTPWALVGLMIVLGSVTAAMYGLPFESRDDGLRAEHQIADLSTLVTETQKQVNTLAMNQAVLQVTVGNVADQTKEISDLRKVVEEQAIHIEGLEADEKANDSERVAHRHY